MKKLMVVAVGCALLTSCTMIETKQPPTSTELKEITDKAISAYSEIEDLNEIRKSIEVNMKAREEAANNEETRKRGEICGSDGGEASPK